jgi:hypothetical protein
MSTDVDEFLAHYGVKGMRWGIVRERDSLGGSPKERKPLTAKQRKILIGTGIAVAVGAVAAASIITKHHLDTKSMNKFLEEVSVNDKLAETVSNGKKFADDFLDHDVYVPKGTEFHRVAGYLEDSVNAPKYATYIGKDVARYRKSWTTLSGTGEKFYKSKFTTAAGSKLASETSAIRLGVELANSPGIKGSKEFRDAVVEWGGSRNAGKPMEEVVGDFVRNNAGGAWDQAPAKRLFEYMSKNGYVGITDTVDTTMIAKHAVVLFNNDIVQTTSSALSQKERDAAYRALKKVLSNV